MFEITKRCESIVVHLINDCSDMQMLGVAAGNNPGRMWADSGESPSSALVWSQGLEGFQFMGRADNPKFNMHIRALVEGEIADMLNEQSMGYFEFAYDGEQWYPLLSQIFEDKRINESWQFVYKSLNDQAAKTFALYEPYQLLQIDEVFFNAIPSIDNPGFVLNYILMNWGSVDSYLKSGHGCAAMDGNEIVAYAITSSLFRKTYTLGIETLEPHRRKGLSSSLVMALNQKLFDKGCVVYWDCMEENIASQKTALKAGLVFDRKYRLMGFGI